MKSESEATEEEINFLNKWYKVHETIGKGGFSIVKKATHRLTGELVAIKIVDKTSTANKKITIKSAIDQEINTLKKIRHPSICKLYQEIRTERYICIVEEYYAGGELYTYVERKGRLEEMEARRLFRQIADAVGHLHSHSICHRDLKLENIMLDSSLNAKLIDFGLCAKVVKDENNVEGRLNLFCGSSAYASPEIVDSQPYIGTKSDIYSLGVLLYCCLCGHFPFYSPNFPELYHLIQTGKYNEPRWLSDGSKRMLQKLLQKDPQSRPDIFQVISDPFCQLKSPKTSPMCTPTNSLDVDVIKKMASAYNSSYDSMAAKLDVSNFADNMTATYFLLLDRKLKFGHEAFSQFGLKIPQSTFEPSDMNTEYGGGDTGCQPNKLAKKDEKTVENTFGKLHTNIFSRFYEARKHKDSFVKLLPTNTIDPYMTIANIKAAFSSLGIQYVHMSKFVLVGKGELKTKKKNKFVMLEIEVQVFIKESAPYNTKIYLKWDRKEGPTNEFKILINKITKKLKIFEESRKEQFLLDNSDCYSCPRSMTL